MPRRIIERGQPAGGAIVPRLAAEALDHQVSNETDAVGRGHLGGALMPQAQQLPYGQSGARAPDALNEPFLA